ncbi:hypothetical protein TWF594_003460 [Orbilia oligospora]|uniref:NACHT domain-containing protein n=1 Tax=Orbilia oligospora TaxID=2813651 RepID=A0A7C8NUT5_ORBOL|nr:hypothetical protein TWF594_003460 [Orbilia oligospora]KAF3138574.1 hypothetical protein TWF703_004622 [Orbilia oligospora]
MDYEAWDTANQSAVLLLSGPTGCDIRQVSFSIIQREMEMARAGGSFVLETPGWGRPFKRDEPLQTKIGHILDAPVDELWSALTVPLISENSKSKRFSVILDGLHYIERERNTYFNGVRSFVERIQEKTTNFKVLLTSLPLVDIKNTFGSFPYIEHDKERKACLDSLRFENTRYGKISREHQGSFRWIWKHNEYLSWSTPNSSRLLYIQGKPGSGKSTLTKYFSQRLKKRDPAVASAIVAKFFYSEREGQRRHHYMLRSILYDILQQDELFFYHRFQGEYRKQVDRGAGDVWGYGSLKTVLQSLADYSAPTERRLYLIIDAVDESSDDDRRNIIKLLFSICGEAKFCIKVFVASRPLGSLEVSRTKFHNFIRLQDETKEDIRRFASSLLDGLELIHYFSEATDYIVNNAYGVFIWVKLVGQELLVYHEEGYSEEAVFELLKELPTELEQFYIRMFRRMNGDRRNISDGFKVFHFVLLARRPLKVIELLHALAIPGNMDTTFTLDTDISEDNFQRRIPPLQRIISCSGNFLEARSVHDGSIGRMSVDSLYNHTVQFMHQTAREFFLSTENCVAESEFRFIGDKAHGNIFITCIRYLTLCMRGISERFPRGESWTLQRFRDCAGYLNERPLVSYALSNLKYHASKCNGDSSLSILIKQFIDEMYRTKGIYLLDRWASGNLGCQPPSSDEESGAWEFKQYLLHAAVWNVLAQATEILILASADGTVEDKDGRTMIWWAAAVGHERVLEALIHTRTNVKISKAANIADCNGRTPLSIAAEQGHDKAVGIILRTNMVDANAGDHWEQTPLWWAAKAGNEKAVAALLEALVDVNKPNRDKQTPLSIAAEGGHEAVVKLILATGKADVNTVDRTKWTPLSWAAHEGHYGVVCQLLSSDKVRVDCKDIWNRTPLLIAAERGHKEVVKVLLEKGNADIASVDEDGWTPLIAATKKGNREVVNFLLGKMTSRNPIFG